MPPAHHEQRLVISGTAEQLVVGRIGTPVETAEQLVVGRSVGAHVGAKLDSAIVRNDAKAALVTMGWKKPVARAAVAEAWNANPDVTLEALIIAALRRCR